MTAEESLITDNYQLELKLMAKTKECEKLIQEKSILIHALEAIKELAKEL